MVGKADQADTAKLLRLQETLRERHQELAGIEDDDRRAEHVGKVFSATNALVNFEAQLPLLREERLRRISTVIVYVATGLAAVAMLAEVVLMLLDRVGWWYALPTAVVTAAAGVLAGGERGASDAGHRGRATAAVLIALSAALVAAATAHVVPGWAVLAVIPVLLVAAGFWASGTGDGEETR
jgi:hypothetical protein